MSDKNTNEVKLEIHLDEETAQGVYVNLASINHTDAEFIIDFIFAQPHVPRAKVRSRIITSPTHVKRLITALQENLQRFEMTHAPEQTSEPQHGGDYH